MYQMVGRAPTWALALTVAPVDGVVAEELQLSYHDLGIQSIIRSHGDGSLI